MYGMHSSPNRCASFVWLKQNSLGQEFIEKTSNGLSCSGGGSQLSGCPRIVSRAEWGAATPTHISNMAALPIYVFIHHMGAGSGCFTEASCKSTVRNMQSYHMVTKGNNSNKSSILIVPVTFFSPLSNTNTFILIMS